MSKVNYRDRNQQRKGFPRYLGAILLILLISVLGAILMMGKLYDMLVEYESGTPNTAIVRYFDDIMNGSFETIRAESSFTPSEKGGWAEYEDAIKKIFGSVSSTPKYRKIASNDPDGRQVYAIYNGAEKLGEIYLYEGQGVDGGWRINAPIEYLPPYTIKAPSHATILVNGAPLRPEDVIALEELEPELFSELPDHIQKPSLLTYTVEGFLVEPEITAETSDGLICSVETNTEQRLIDVTLLADGDRRDLYAARIEATAKAYATFISRDGYIGTLSAYLLPNTDFYTRMWAFDNQWYAIHQSYEFRDLVVYDIISCTESCFIGTIDYVFAVTNGATVYDYPSSYTMSFTLSNGVWLLVDLQVN